MTRKYTLLLPLTVLIALSGCSSAEFASGDSESPEAAYDNASSTTSTLGEADTNGSTDYEPENENDFLALRPAQTDVYVFIANPTRNTVTRVDVFTQAVDTIEVGANPTAVLTTPDYSTAIVFNEDDDTVTILDASTLDEMTTEVRPNFNTMVLSHDGGWAALWYNPDANDQVSSDGGIQSFNEVSFVNVSTGEHHPMAVGPNPSQVIFTKDDSLALVVSDESLAAVELSQKVLTPEMITIVDDLLDPPTAEEVVLSPDGTYAFVRQFGAEEITIVDIATHDVSTIEAGGNPTDLDLTPDGGHAVIVARDSGELWIYDTSDPYGTPEVIETPDELLVGSVLIDPTGQRALLYSTAVLQDIYATWDIATGDLEVRPLEKPIQTASIAPTGDTLLLFHTEEDAANADTGSPFYGEHAMTMIDLDDYRTTAVLLPAEANGYAHSTNGNYGFFIMEGEPFLVMLDYASLLPYEYELKSEPVYVGVLPDLNKADGDEPPTWVSQEHDLGRISFFDPDDGSMETITGFELNSQIEER